jgi:hypothetical protein
MDKYDLKSMWHDAHPTKQGTNSDKANFEKSLTMNHSNAVCKILSDIKLKVTAFSLILLIYIGLMFYAFVYLGLNLSVYSLVPLASAGLFLLYNTTSEIIRLSIMKMTADTLSVKESMIVFRKKLDRIKTIDFISYLIFFYLSAILIIFNYLTDVGGINNLSWNNEFLPLPVLGILILILLLFPWFIRYQHKQRYKNLYSNLNEAARLLTV